MKKTLNFVGRIMAAIILCAVSAVSFIGMLAYYREPEALPFAVFGAVCLFGALAMTMHEEGKTAPTAKNRKRAATSSEAAA